jgi:hypothetical protein
MSPRNLWMIVLACLMCMGGYAQLPSIAQGQVWRVETATKIRFERALSFAEMNIYAQEFPYWETLDSATLARINHDLRRFKPWEVDMEKLNERLPGYLDSCRLTDRDRGRWFEFVTDTLAKNSPFHGSKAEIIDQECLCLLTQPRFMIVGTQTDGSTVKIYLGYLLDGHGYAMLNGKYYARYSPTDDNLFPRWLGSWKPKKFPPPLPNWPEKYRQMFENH